MAGAAAQAPKPPERATDGAAATQAPKPPEDATDGADEDDSGTYQPSNGSKEQKAEIDRISNIGGTRYHKILNVPRTYKTPAKEKTEILRAFRKIGTLIHPDSCENPNAEAAFQSKS